MRKIALIILDGWGLGDEADYNAIYKARTPFFDHLWQNYAHTKLEASGKYVGLPEGQIGGSEVGHLTIGVGRVVFQSLPKISRALMSPEESYGIYASGTFQSFVGKAREYQPHLVGLVSDGGVHSHIDHLLGLLDLLKKNGCKEPLIHVITDGRDTPPESASEYIQSLVGKIDDLKFGKIVTLSGRFYAMDRDRNWSRTDKAAQLMIAGTPGYAYAMQGDWHQNWRVALDTAYRNGITDEFVEPMLIDPRYDGMQAEEPVLFFNFRSDRMKQLVTQIAARIGDEQITTMTRYDKEYNFAYIFDKESVSNSLGELFSAKGMTQLRATETEKAPHVTYFFNGGVEVTYDGEVRSIAESNKVTHDQIPEMKAIEVVERVSNYVKEHLPDFVLVNFANPDMVGHTGKMEAVIRGVETVDGQLQRLVEVLRDKGYVTVVTADHGNADIMFDPETGEPHTAHTLNPVPFVIVDDQEHEYKLDQSAGIGLDRIAATLCELAGIEVPQEYSRSLLL
jgi:2,3-bisphosphoglycerate-independent phosphoglycerate mutase